MLAANMHLPIPVFDGDNLKSGEACPATAISQVDAYDVDFILLGCDLPDDTDDGPVDDDPENGSNSVFGPLCLKATWVRVFLLACAPYAFACVNSGCYDGTIITDQQIEVTFRDFSFGKLCQSGTANLRC